MIPENVIELERLLDERVQSLSYSHQKTRRASHALADCIIRVLLSSRGDRFELIDLLWKKCQYGPLNYYRGLANDKNVHGLEDIEKLLFECIGYQITVMSGLGGHHSGLLNILHLSYIVNNDHDDPKLCAVNAVHLGDLFRYLAVYKGSAFGAYALTCYESACLLNPGYGLAWNQLGVMHSKNDIIKAVYYYIRALNARDPFVTARKNLEGCLSAAGNSKNTSIQMLHEYFVRKKKIDKFELTENAELQFILDYVKNQCGPCEA